MPKKKSNYTALLILALIIVLIIGGNKGWFKFSINNYVTNQEILNQLEAPPTYSECSATVSPRTITAGDTVTGTVQDGKNVLCEVYGIMVGTPDWRKIAEGTTNSAGTLTFTEPFSVVGSFRFRVICEDCITNYADLTVLPAPATTPCVDYDGKNKMVPGHATDASGTYYDDCAGNWAVTEYFCVGDSVTSQVIGCDAGYICYETRSGDYCKSTTGTTTTTVLPSTTYTCGKSDWCYYGTCPDGYTCEKIDSLQVTWCACINERLGLVHPDWKPDGTYYPLIK